MSAPDRPLCRAAFLELSEWGRPIAWLARWSWYHGQAYGYGLFSTAEEAIKYAVCQSLGNADWDLFPDPSKKYPDDDRDGSLTHLTPLFRVSWEGGFAEVVRCEVDGKFRAAPDRMRQVEEKYGRILVRQSLQTPDRGTEPNTPEAK